MMSILIAAAVFAAFTLSATAGFGGSLIMVPALTLLLGPKVGVALSALLLSWNNLFKLIAYRNFVKGVWKPGLAIVAFTLLGVFFGAKLLVAVPEVWVSWSVIVSFALTLAFELWKRLKAATPSQQLPTRRLKFQSTIYAPVLACFSGATSGFSGTSGPLKGVALRNLNLDHMQFVAAASMVSFAGDLLKVGIFAEAGLLQGTWNTLLWAVPLMLLGTYAGYRMNRNVEERWFSILFWTVMGAYTLRLAGLWI
jgi:uncharacterized protein